MKRKLALYLVFGTMLVGSLQLVGTAWAQGRLTMAMILTGLQTRGTNPETSTLAKRNIYIQKQVEARGVNFTVTPEREQDLRDAGATPALIAAIRRNGPVTAPTPSPSGPSAKFNRVWVDYNYTQGGERGMLVHVDFEVTGLRGVDSQIGIRIMKDDDDFLPATGSYRNADDELYFTFEMKPGYPTSVFKDATVFIPFSAINLPKGKHMLKLDIDVAYESGELIQHLAFHPFEFTSVGKTQRPDPEDVTATVNRVWVDYNITQNGKRGMLIHVNFDVTGLQSVESKLAIRVARENNTFLMSDGVNSNEKGELQVVFDMLPGFPTTAYKDAQVFLPYEDIVISKGVWNLKLDLDLLFDDGSLIKHLHVHAFQFTQR